MRNWRETLEWYRTHQTTQQIGFNPDGMCLKLCRTARDIGPHFLTAKMSQDGTPKEHRIAKVSNLRRGMVLYFDTVGDSNTAGHIVTMIGRVKGADRNSLHDILVETNSVKSGESVVVRGDYFKDNWDDEFQFGATWLNGQELDIPAGKKDEPDPVLGKHRAENFRDSRPNWDVKILDRSIENGRRDLRPLVKEIEDAVDDLPDDTKETRVKDFKQSFKKDRVLRMHLLQVAVEDGRFHAVKRQRDRINSVLKKILN